jgi:hypothetical protein
MREINGAFIIFKPIKVGMITILQNVKKKISKFVNSVVNILPMLDNKSVISISLMLSNVGILSMKLFIIDDMIDEMVFIIDDIIDGMVFIIDNILFILDGMNRYKIEIKSKKLGIVIHSHFIFFKLMNMGMIIILQTVKIK